MGKFSGRPAIAVDLGAHTAVLNVASKRSAIGAYLEHVKFSGVDAPWRVVANTQGRVNKVLLSDPG